MFKTNISNHDNKSFFYIYAGGQKMQCMHHHHAAH